MLNKNEFFKINASEIMEKAHRYTKRDMRDLQGITSIPCTYREQLGIRIKYFLNKLYETYVIEYKMNELKKSKVLIKFDLQCKLKRRMKKEYQKNILNLQALIQRLNKHSKKTKRIINELRNEVHPIYKVIDKINK